MVEMVQEDVVAFGQVRIWAPGPIVEIGVEDVLVADRLALTAGMRFGEQLRHDRRQGVGVPFPGLDHDQPAAEMDRVLVAQIGPARRDCRQMRGIEQAVGIAHDHHVGVDQDDLAPAGHGFAPAGHGEEGKPVVALGPVAGAERLVERDELGIEGAWNGGMRQVGMPASARRFSQAGPICSPSTTHSGETQPQRPSEASRASTPSR